MAVLEVGADGLSTMPSQLLKNDERLESEGGDSKCLLKKR